MTPAEFKAARHALGLSAAKLARVLAVHPRTVQKWETEGDEYPPNSTACRVMEWLAAGYRPPQWPSD